MAEYCRRLLRDNSGAHRCHRRSREKPEAPWVVEAGALCALQRAGAARDPARHEFRQYWRTYERDWLAEVFETNSEWETRRGSRYRAPTGGGWRADHRHQ